MRIIPVTKPYLPPLDEFIPYLEEIWKNHQLTNNGPFHQQLEQALCSYLGVEHLSLFSNGTLALVTALQALRIKGEVITTPYSFVATSHALIWNNLTPVFVDVKPGSFNIDATKIEEAITPNTTAILPVHCYSTPCEVEEIQRIADNYGLRVIYDAAHAFGTKYKDESILNNGDMSVLSFHATKVFNTFEGGAIISSSAKLKQRVDYLKNFGFANEVTIVAPGINAKMSEVNAAFGLLQLKYVNDAISQRKVIFDRYCYELSGVAGIDLPLMKLDGIINYSYFPILVNDDYIMNRDMLYNKLKSEGIFARRYFYPLISNIPMYNKIPSSSPHNLINANSLSSSVICLPLYPGLDSDSITRIIALIKNIHC
ncbi:MULTISPECIES: DegT/DnrJ/EryC1/StrS family aminotransferase [Aeromonas]|uniref:DegT/DnrJ/EryC1/StrS family aminotransferase n=1 Tax=Aeromonas TaxID=642 RepID=UPI001BAA2906|nr:MULTISPECIES: DegT/DnrJ/EryC1/StrS family aminotransferase [Aeromonas]MBS2783745.1 DegT/DnrJ/EryC1/StrS family aminotransferase [Aeromonas salmonicida]